MNFLLPKLALLLSFLAHFPLFSSKIDGFENPLLKIDGFGRTHRTSANAAPDNSSCPLTNQAKRHFLYDNLKAQICFLINNHGY